MKSYKEMSDSVIKRVSEHKEKQKEIKKKMKKFSLAITSLAVVTVIIVGIWQSGLFADKTDFETEIEISKNDSYMSKYKIAEENTKAVTAEKNTTKAKNKNNTTKKEATTKNNIIPEQTTASTTEDNQHTTSEDIPLTFEQPQKMIYYYDGISGGYSLLYADVLMFELTNSSLNEWTETDVVDTQAVIDNVKNYDRAVELLYDSEQSIQMILSDGTVKVFSFDRILFVLSGENQQLLFFGYNGTYSSDVLRTANTHSVDSMLSCYYPELLETESE